MFGIVRLIVVLVFIGCSITAINKSRFFCKRLLYVVFISMSVALISVLAFLPFENLFVTFDSPKAAYEYYNFGESNIELVLEGNNCDFVVDRKTDTDTYLIIPKKSDGWKIGIGIDTKRIVEKFSNGIAVYVYQYKNTSDYFITILDTKGGETTISDDYNTKFSSLKKNNDFLGKTFITYYAHISNYNPQYSLIVNGNRIALQ